jgi:L-2-hydroxyglutarate oxidase
MCDKMGEQIRESGGEVWLDTQVSALIESEEYVSVECSNGKTVRASFVIACTGLQADRTASMMGIPIDFRIVPYRGEYFQLPESMNSIVNHLIYPVPDPSLPFLGVHLTKMIDGSVTVGPNAVQGWKREGYGRLNLSPRDIASMLSFPGFWRVTLTNLGPGLDELWNSVWKRGYLKQVQKYCPTIKLNDLTSYPAGVRAQAVTRDGKMVEDFLFAESNRSLHVCNAPSPAATAAIPIGEFIVEKVLRRNGR